MESALEENDLMVEWLSKLESETFKVEEDIVKMSDSLDKAKSQLAAA